MRKPAAPKPVGPAAAKPGAAAASASPAASASSRVAKAAKANPAAPASKPAKPSARVPSARAPAFHTLVDSLQAPAAARLVQAASDVALLLDDAGTVLSVALQDPELPEDVCRLWVGQPWLQTVAPDSRQKIELLLRDAARGDSQPRWRQINHPTPQGEDLPLLVTAVRIAPADAPPGAGAEAASGAAQGPASPRRSATVAVFGRNLRSTVVLQQRLVESQQAMERDYWRFREAETRYRHLFQTSAEAVLIVDALTQKILEVNPAAMALCGAVAASVNPQQAGNGASKLVGTTLLALFSPGTAPQLQTLLAAARTVGRKDAMRAALAMANTEVLVSASVFRQDDSAFVLVRLVPAPKAAAAKGKNKGSEPLSEASTEAANEPLAQAFMQGASDAIVITDAQGRVLQTNRAFTTLAQLGAEEQVRGQMLDRWIGRTGVELGVLMSNLRQRGSAGLFVTAVRGEMGGVTNVEIAASVMSAAPGSALAFCIRNVERRMKTEAASGSAVTRSVGDLTDLVGNVPLKDIVSETTDLIEQLCIETALDMTGDKRSSAALLLGLSRQSLYVKLRRFGLADQGTEEQI
jgi:transcriptional regulator PpsR